MPPHLQLRLPAHHLAARLGRARVRDCAALAGLAESEIERLEFVTGELLSNAIDHGGGGGALDESQWIQDVHMHLELSCQATGWRLTVEDEGGGDPDDLRKLVIEPDDPEAIPDLDDERGRGFFLLRNMVDRLEVEAAVKGQGIALIASVRLGAIDAIQDEPNA